MLAEMSARQYVELMAYVRIRSEAKADGKAEAEERNTMQWFARLAAKQKERDDA